MSSQRHLEVRRFNRVADQRLEEARFLLKNGYPTAAVYLAGYAVECALKALLLAHTPSKRHAEVVRSFRGRFGHDFDWLRARLHRCGVVVVKRVLDGLHRIRWWTTELRYQPKTIAKDEATEFLSTTELIVNWTRGGM